MAFRSNELGFGSDHGIVCRNKAISDTRVALEMARNAMEADFHFSHTKSAFSTFGVPKSGFFLCEAAIETANGKL
jgi:hypothetical protein